MTTEELLAKIKAEIDKLYGEYKDKFHQSGDQYHLGLIDGLDMAERVLDTLESEKPMMTIVQAEKDLALTWEDAQLLHIITEKYMREIDNRIETAPSSSQEVFEEIIRRFQEARK